MNASFETELDVAATGRPTTTFIRDVILHPRLRVDLELLRIDGRAEFGVVLPRVLTIAITFGVVDVFSL